LPPSDGQRGLLVDREEIEQMAVAAQVVSECRRVLAARNRNVVSEVTAGDVALSEWRHYPEGDAYDPKSHAQYFYHSHPALERLPREHGHFHTFLRAEGMPAGVAPLLLPEIAVADVAALPPQAAPLKRGTKEEVSHLVAVAVDARGEPIRLFTTNRWVTGETWYRADDVIRMLERFAVNEPEPSATLNLWVGAMLRLFRPQIAALLRARDDTIVTWRRRRRTHVFEDPTLEITSSLEINLDAHLVFLDRARSHLARSGPRARTLPAMAEGWGEDHAG
jgi:hypothetical protein